MTDNPFAALITKDPCVQPNRNQFSECLESIFGFTLNKIRSESLKFIFLEEIFNNFKTTDLNLQILEHALFDRLFMCMENGLITELTVESPGNHAYESKAITYLYNCFQNVLENKQLKPEDISVLKKLIFQNVATTFKEPDIYFNQDVYGQLAELLKESLPYNDQFFVESIQAIQTEKEESLLVLEKLVGNLVSLLLKDVTKSSLMTFDHKVFRVIQTLISKEVTADIFIIKCQPSKPEIGIEYVNTLLGAIMNISITPKTPNGQYEYFLTPLDHASNSITEGNLWMNADKLAESLHEIIKTLLKCNSAVKEKTLSWIGNCLKANADRGKLWSSQAPAELNPASYITVSDGFMINLSNILLRLSIPFCTKTKILKIDPTYCAIPVEKQKGKGVQVHLSNMNSETCLIPTETIDEQPEERLCAESYSFLTECFYLTHRGFDLGYRIACERIVHLNQELGRVERAYNEAIQQGAGNSDVANMLKDKMTQDMTRYLCHKAQLLEPIQVKMMFDFASATTYWLSQVAVHHPDMTNSVNYAPLEEIPITFPLPQEIPDTLKCIPEFIVENVVLFLICQRRFNPSSFEETGHEKLSPILTFILIFMGSKERMKNPHIRARLAEGLESLLPYHKDQPQGLNKLGSFQREMLFEKHAHKHQIVPSLLEVFVGIEMTGQSVEFEQKFNYRRPMYVVMDYLWSIDEYQACFKLLAKEAEQNMEAVSPPLFLRFVNLLLNDAVFLLDEALASMAKLREMQAARENGEWDNLPANERAQNMGYLHHTGMIARFDNILGKETIKTLEHLTSKITIVFTHPTMVDRVAAMLNYFLFTLVGPNKKNFKVKDQKEFNFDPAATVIDICKIYVNLKDNDAFCLAISQDGRSYSPQLFDLAEDVLVRIGGGILISELKEVAEKVAVKAKEYQDIEEIIAEAPDHFIDPIMSSIMSDPVILPSSRQVVDRTTIARHLLSDQTDPFNRAPLSMDLVIPNNELAEEIRRWKEQRKKSK